MTTRKAQIALAVVALGLTRAAIAQTNTFPSSGNTGIGTTTPGTSLFVKGPFTGGYMQLALQSTAADDRVGISFWNASGSTRLAGFYAGNDAHSYLSGTELSNGIFHIYSAGADRMTFLPSGNVGIGHSNPVAPLHIFRTGQPELRLQSEGRHWSILTNSAWGNNGFAVYDITADVSRLQIDTSGNVGIGTISPEQKLHVLGNVRISGGRVTVGHATNNGNNSGIWLWHDGDSSHAIYSADSSTGIRPGGSVVGDAPDNRLGGAGIEHRLRFRTALGQGWLFENNANVGVIDFKSDDGSAYFGGNVGIGTTNPTQKLSVNGTIRAKEVIVEASPWPDDVFEDGYRLRTLSEVAAHIEAKGHLPDVPSAATVAEQGVGVGEMQRTLLRKVEELTLYIIAQQKQADESRSELARQSARIDRLETENAELRAKISSP